MTEEDLRRAERASSSDTLARLATTFETSAKRWELIVYPSLFAFVVLAVYGFYLIFSLSKDVSRLADSVEKSMVVVADRMNDMTGSLETITGTMRVMTSSLDSMSEDTHALRPMLKQMDAIKVSMGSLNTSVNHMNRSVSGMNQSTAMMRHDMSSMNQSIGRPMSFVNRMMPW